MKKTIITLLLTSILAGSACFALTGCKNTGDAEATAAPTAAATTAATTAAETVAQTATQADAQEKSNDTASKADSADDNASSAAAEATDWELNDYDDDEIDYQIPMNYTNEHAVEKVFAEMGYGEGYSASGEGWVTIPGDTDIWHNVIIYEGYTPTDDDMVASYYLNDRTDEILTTVELEVRAYGDTLN